MSTKPGLLIVTNRSDFAADFLITRLLELELPYFRLDADDLVSTRVTSETRDEIEETRLRLGPRELELSTVGCIWYRRALRPALPDNVSQGFRAFAATELRHVYEGLLNARARWVNPLLATEAAERKLFQLRL